eukprot:Tamp_08213.p1 GENE.Tamp_08213~~Tamp_08213.p1  ORF type:complete len:185 (+),score=13.70 Tamp_08213:390-944(+)
MMCRRMMCRRMMYVLRGPSLHPGARTFWLGGGCEDARGIGSVGDGIGEGPCTRYALTNGHACSLRVYETGACLTNCMIIGVTSEQAHSWFPAYFSVEAKRRGLAALCEEGDAECLQNAEIDAVTLPIRPGKGQHVMAVIFLAEHALLFACFMIRAFIPKVPRDIRHAIHRRDYLQLGYVPKRDF